MRHVLVSGSWSLEARILGGGSRRGGEDMYGRLAEEFPESNSTRMAKVMAYGAMPAVMRGPAGMFLGVLMAFVGLILLITCANVAGMFLARASARKKEIAIRLSLGSARGQLIRHLLTESILIFFLGGVAGVFLAKWGLRALSSFDLPAPYPISLDLSPDLGVLLFAAGLTLVTGLTSGCSRLVRHWTWICSGH